MKLQLPRVRTYSCGPLHNIPEGVPLAVPIVPAWTFRDPDLGTMRCGSALVIRRGLSVRAYANVCRHVPVTLDLGDGVVASPDGQYFFCHHHGAKYRTDDGVCADGPCDGETLYRLDLDLSSGELILLLP